ncbi:MAG TPA: GAF domain-containing protein [Chloroflexota bacterium]|nr:GAF domain-containing protein [Chloroflexota bacterium]
MAARFGVLRGVPVGALGPPSRASVTGRAILDRETIHVADITKVPEDEYPVSREAFRDHGNRSGLSVPLLREGSAIGAISVRRAEASPFSTQQIKLLETFADQAVIAISNAELFQKLQERNRNLTEALEQQTATSEVLKVISRSAFVLRPVLETLLENAVKLCGADGGAVHGPDGRAELTYGYSAEFRDLVLGKPFTPGRGTLTGRVMLERRAIHVSDVLADPDYEWTAGQHAGGYRTMLGIPMLHDEVIVGSFSLMRFRTEAFTDRQVELVSTFADQAVIAIENTRLIEELQQRLDEQTATSEILRVISQSPTDLPAVLETITASAARLCEADDVNLIRRFGDRIRTVTSHGDLARMVATWVGSLPPDIGGPAGLVLDRGTTTGRGILDREIVHVPNVEAESVEEFPIAHRAMPSLGVKTLLSAPLIRDDQGIGAITIYRRDVRPFTEKQIKLLETFASQAVIAISNTELFQQLEDRNRELGGALAQQTALSNVLKVISRSAFDLQPVLDTLAENATLLSRADYGYIMGLEGTVFTPVATFSQGPDQDQGLRYVREHPLALDRGSVTGRAGLERRPVQVEDVLTDADYTLTDVQRIGQYRSMLAVPLLRDDTLLGVIALMRLEVRPFSAREVDLISTFADQAVIAIENSRLIEELQQRLEEQTANAEVLRVISESPTELQKVLDTIASAAARLCGTNHAQIYRVVPDGVNLIAHFGDGQDLPIGTVSPLSRGGVTHRAILESQTIHVPDILDLPEDEYPVTRPLAVEGGIRSHLAVPLLRGNFAIGAITVRRPLAAPFSDKQVKLLETFADQAVIAISNAELFQQLQDRSRELATSVEQLQAMFEVGQAVSSTLDLETVLRTIAARAVELSGVDGGIIYEMDERAGHLRLRTAYQIDPDLVTTLQETPLPIGEGASGRAVATRAPVQIPDTLAEGAYQGRLRELVLRSGFRALLAVPLLHEDRVIGSLVVNRTSPGEFAPDVVELVKTFASQSAIALQNARLFRELEEKSHELEVASQHKSEFLANMSHELRTPLNAIIGFSEVLIERMFGELNDKQADYLQDIVSSGRHLLLLINDILDLSKVEAGRMELENGLFSLTELLDGGLTMVRERASRHGVTLDLVVDPRIDLIEGDERKIKQVVFNLLSNAVKFTPDGGRVELVARLGDGETLVCVQDTGIGIALEEVERIFEEFHQAKQAASSEREGTGLGLTLARRFVELHGGRIWVESQIGAGSTFTFTLPLRQGVTRNGAGLTGGSIPVNPSLDELDDRPVVLVVEDDPSAANLLSLYLTGAGFQVALAADGDAGLELSRRLRLGARADQLRRRPAAIALDIVLPRLDGWDFLARLKADAVLADIPVIVVSMLDERGKGFALGAAEYLVKPVGRDDLLAALRRVEVRAHSRTAQPKVLAIDDDPMALDLVEALLDPAGYVVLKAPGGREGIALARTELPAVIVLDLLMPDVDGFAVVEALGADPATASIPIVVLTSKTMTAADKARLNGRIAVLARKTEFDRERFVELIRRWSSAGKEAFHGR